VLDDIQMIFTSTTGRSGTRFLANLVNVNALNATAEHDPYPRGYGDPIRWLENKETKKLRHLAVKKCNRLQRDKRYRLILNLPIIREMYGRGNSQLDIYDPFHQIFRYWAPSVELKDIYIESTHAFLKSFGDAIYHLLPNMELIHLTRDPLEVAKSFSNRKSIPGPDNPFLLDPNFKTNKIKLKIKMTDFQKCLWYWLESEVRHVTFLEKHDVKKVYEIDVKELNDKRNVEKIFKKLHISYEDLVLNIARNQNKTPTNISEQDYKEATELVNALPDWVFDTIGDKYHLITRLFKKS